MARVIRSRPLDCTVALAGVRACVRAWVYAKSANRAVAPCEVYVQLVPMHWPSNLNVTGLWRPSLYAHCNRADKADLYCVSAKKSIEQFEIKIDVRTWEKINLRELQQKKLIAKIVSLMTVREINIYLNDDGKPKPKTPWIKNYKKTANCMR